MITDVQITPPRRAKLVLAVALVGLGAVAWEPLYRLIILEEYHPQEAVRCSISPSLQVQGELRLSWHRTAVPLPADGNIFRPKLLATGA